METPLKIAICEDERDDALFLQNLAEQSGIQVQCEVFESGYELLGAFQTGQYDLIFMDIYMQGMQGVEAVRIIRETNENVVIAFTTSSQNHALESYRLKALRYLEKPVNPLDIKETLELALLKRRTRAHISLLIGGKHTDIPLDSIHYFEHCNHAVKVHTSTGVLRTSQTVRMGDVEMRLPSPPFYRCHHSFIVNLRYVREVDADIYSFIMKNGERAHIRQALVKKMRNVFEEYMFASARNGEKA